MWPWKRHFISSCWAVWHMLLAFGHIGRVRENALAVRKAHRLPQQFYRLRATSYNRGHNRGQKLYFRFFRCWFPQKCFLEAHAHFVCFISSLRLLKKYVWHILVHQLLFQQYAVDRNVRNNVHEERIRWPAASQEKATAVKTDSASAKVTSLYLSPFDFS